MVPSGSVSLCNQCCHSKKIENPRLGNNKPKKTQGQISIRFRKISGKNRTFPEKKQTFPKKVFLSAKISDDFFLVIASDFQIFYPDFSNFYHFSPKMSDFLQKTTKINVFSGKFKKNQEKPKVLSKTLEKTQGPQKKPQEPKIASENPRSWEKTQAVATLSMTETSSSQFAGWFPNLTRAYDNNGRCPRQKFVLGILQLHRSLHIGLPLLDTFKTLQTNSILRCKPIAVCILACILI